MYGAKSILPKNALLAATVRSINDENQEENNKRQVKLGKITDF